MSVKWGLKWEPSDCLNPLGHSAQTLELGHLIGYLISKIFMEKVCRESAVKKVPYLFAVLVNIQNSQFMQEIFGNKLF